MPKADATGLAPKKSADPNPPVPDSSVREGLVSVVAPRSVHSSGKLSSAIIVQSHNINPFLW
jgi:hypothetical protein